MLEYGKGLREYSGSSYPVFGTNGQIGWHDVPLCKEPGIIIGRKGAYRGVHYSKQPFFVIDTAFFLKPKTKDFDVKWAYYQLLDFDVNNIDSGSAIPSTSREAFYAIPVRLPPLPTQQKIVSILSFYDDLIENNNHRSKILEEMVKTIYDEWFVKFRFPGHEKVKMVGSELGPIPEGWGVAALGDILELAYGKSLQKERRVHGKIPVYGSGGIVGFHNNHLVEGPGIIVGRKGNVGSVFWSQQRFFPIDTVFFVKSKISLYYLFFVLKAHNFINNDAAVPGLNRHQAYLSKILLPSIEALNQFSDYINAIFNQIENLQSKIENLKNTRDLLLPKLISGEIDVEHLDINTGDFNKPDIQHLLQ